MGELANKQQSLWHDKCCCFATRSLFLSFLKGQETKIQISKLFSLLSYFIFIFSSKMSASAPLLPVPTIEDIRGDINPLFESTSYKTVGAKIWWINYQQIRRDFKELRQTTEEEIREFILNCAYINEKQLKLVGFRNTEIPYEVANTRKVYQTSAHVRGAMVPTPFGLVDIKGFGHGAVKWIERDKEFDFLLKQYQALLQIEDRDLGEREIDKLRLLSHSDGLISGVESLVEMFSAIGSQEVFQRAGLLFHSVLPYALIRYPFDIIQANGRKVPAIGYVRQLNFNRYNSARPPPGVISGVYHQATDYDRFLIADFGNFLILEKSLFLGFMGTEAPSQNTVEWLYKHEDFIPRVTRMAIRLSLRLDDLSERERQSQIDLALAELIPQLPSALPWNDYRKRLDGELTRIIDRFSGSSTSYVERYQIVNSALMNSDAAMPFFGNILKNCIRRIPRGLKILT